MRGILKQRSRTYKNNKKKINKIRTGGNLCKKNCNYTRGNLNENRSHEKSKFRLITRGYLS